MTRNILIIDANISFAVSIKRALEDGGNYSVRNVTRLRPAVDALEQAPYDAAVIDTKLEFSTVGEVVVALRNMQADLPIILSSAYEDDSKLVTQVGAQGFMTKPYVARMLIPVIEDAVARGYSPHTIETQPNLAQKLEDQDRQEILEPMLEASRHNASTMMEEPPTTADDSTIAEVIDQALRPEVSQKIYATIDSEPLPDDATEILQERRPIKNSDEEDSQPTPAEAALSATLGATSLDALLEEIRNYASGHLLRPDENDGVRNPINEVIAATPPPQKPRGTSSPIYPPPINDETRLDFIPPPPRLPDQEWLDQFPADETAPEPPFEATNFEDEVTADEELIPVTLEEMTQQMVAVLVEEMEAEEIEKEAAALILDNHVLAHYALQLTSFAMESSALGAILTRDGERLTQAGNLEEAAWDQIVELILENWNLPGDSRIRVLYRNLGFGDILIYSIQSRDNLILTLIFDAEMPLKIIRRQASRLSETLVEVPEPSAEELTQEPPLAAEPPIESPAEPPVSLGRPSTPPPPPTLPESQTTGKTPVSVVDAPSQEQESPFPDEDREGNYDPHESLVGLSPVDQHNSYEYEGSQELAVQAPPEPPKLPRQAGTYIGYGCVWLVENPRNAINPSAADMILGWLQDICHEEDWDLVDSHIEPEWIYVAVEVPVASLPNIIAETLMNGTAERALALDPSSTRESPWALGYLVRTPANSITTDDIERFIRFYRSNRI